MEGCTVDLVAVVHLVKKHAPADLSILLRREHVLQIEIQYAQHFLMAPHMKFTAELSGKMALDKHANHPYHPQDMVGMGVGDKNVVYVATTDARPLQLGEYAIAAASVDEQKVLTIVHHKTGVVAPRNEGVPRS